MDPPGTGLSIISVGLTYDTIVAYSSNQINIWRNKDYRQLYFALVNNVRKNICSSKVKVDQLEERKD